MKLEEFQLLNDKDKEIVVWNNGVFLKNFNDGTYVCDVYKLFEFYIAFYYELHKLKRAKITAAVCQEALPVVCISCHELPKYPRSIAHEIVNMPIIRQVSDLFHFI